MRSRMRHGRVMLVAAAATAVAAAGCAFVIGVDEDPVRTDRLTLDAGDEDGDHATADEAGEPSPEPSPEPEPPPEPSPSDPDV